MDLSSLPFFLKFFYIGGKLFFQTLNVEDSLVLVVSPLNSLVTDQLQEWRARGVTCAATIEETAMAGEYIYILKE